MTDDEEQTRWGVVIGALVGLVAVLAILVFAIPDIHQAASAATRGDTDALKHDLKNVGAASALIFLVLMLIHSIVPYPTEVVTVVIGYLYGFWLGVPFVLFGWLLSGLATYAIGRYAGRPIVRKLAGGERFEKAERAVDRGGVVVLLCARLVPIIPFSLVGYVAGAAHVPVVRFAWTTVVGYVPLSVAIVLLGAQFEELSWSNPLLWVALVPLLLAVLAARPIARRLRLEDEAT